MQKIFILGLLIFLIAGGAYFLGKNSSEDSPEQVACTQDAKICPDGSAVGRVGLNCEFAQCPAEKVDETTNWKTYINTKVGFQMKYPPRYSQPVLPSGLGPTLYTDGSEDNTQIIFGEKSTDSIGLQVFSFSGSFDELVNYNKIPSYDGNSKLTLVKTLKVDGNDARWYTATPPKVYPEDEGKIGVIKVYFISKNHGFILNANIDYSQNEIDQILSTFKFTN